MSRQLSDDDSKEYTKRYRVLYIIVTLTSLIVFSRLWYLQILKGDQLKAYSEKNRIKETKIPAPRGLILDRNQKVLVDNLPGFVATITPQFSVHLDKMAKALSPIIQIPVKRIISVVKRSRRKNGLYRPVKIKENLNLTEVVKIKRIMLYHPGLNIKPVTIRYYPLQDVGAQLLGYVGEISNYLLKKLKRKDSNTYRFELGDIIGKSGLEEVWDKELRGENGISFTEVDARGRGAKKGAKNFLGLEHKPAVQGHNLVLTIDKDIQLAARKAMNRQDKIGPRIGALVAMKSTGEIIAWINSPSYNPNNFATGIPPKIWNELKNNPHKPLRNKVIQDHYPPGSIFKPIVALAALQEGVITTQSLVYAPGSYRFGNRTYHDHSRNGYGKIGIYEAIERSSNVFFYKMGHQLGIDKIAAYARALGLGSRTKIGLNNEVPGLIPTKKWKLKRFGEEWQPGEDLSNAIGQGFILTTPLQMAVAFNTIGLEGLHYKPFLVKRILDIDNNVIQEFKPELIRDLTLPNMGYVTISKENFKSVKEGMKRVSNGAHGTARWYKIPGVKMAGKTGTVQLRSYSADQIYDKCNERPFKQRHHGWFVGFAPVENPQITVAILAEHSCSGSSGGAPIVRDTIKAYFEKYHPELLKKKIIIMPKKSKES